MELPGGSDEWLAPSPSPPGPQFLIDTTNTGWGLLSGHQWGPPLGHQWGLFHGHGQLAIGSPRLDTGRGTGQTFDVLRRLRNALVHYEPEWEHDFVSGALSRDLESRLKGRLNCQQIGEPRFPNKLLGAGCAEWAVETSVAFASEWHTAMGLDLAAFDRIVRGSRERR